MDALRKLLLLCLLAVPSVAGAQTITNLPAASIPLSGSEQVPCVQSGVTKKCALGSVAALSGGTLLTTVLPSATTSYTALLTDTLIAFNSPALTTKAVVLPACSATILGKQYVIKDEYGNSATYSIRITPVSGTIEKTSVTYINSNSASGTFVCDGVSNWMEI